MFFDRGTFWALPLTYLYLPKSARVYLSPNLSKFITFAAAPLVLTPFVRNQGPIMVKGNHLQQCVHQVEGTNFVDQTRCPEFKNKLSWATTGFPNVPVTHASVMWVLDRSSRGN